jgi:hypothetical protein
VAGKTKPKAIAAYVAPIREALGCFATGMVTADCYKPNEIGTLAFNRGTEVRLSGEANLLATISMKYSLCEVDDPVRGPWKVSIRGWMYGLFSPDAKPIVEYHWHPISDSEVRDPHLHVAGDKRHLRTGRVLIEDVLQVAVEHGAVPRDPGKWAEVEARNREAFARGATWGIGPMAGPA